MKIPYALILALMIYAAPFLPARADPYDPARIWQALFDKKPFPYRIPLAEETETPIDGTYTRTLPVREPPVPCKRCADWRPEGGVWKISFQKGIFRILHTGTTWHDMGTYYVAGDRVLFANDPVCHEEFGLYIWKKEGSRIRFEALDDACGIQLRAANLTRGEWLSCTPPNREAAISTHWPKPEGCE